MSGRTRMGRGAGSFLVALGGCDIVTQQGPLSASQMEDLKLREVGELYRLHQVMAQESRPARSRTSMHSATPAPAAAYGAIRSGEVVVRWQATLPDTDAEPSSPTSDEVLAYWKTVPEKGGPVLMLDRRLRRMTAEEFKAARLAGTEEQKSPKSREQGASGTARRSFIGGRMPVRPSSLTDFRPGRFRIVHPCAAIGDRQGRRRRRAPAILSANEPISGSSIAT